MGEPIIVEAIAEQSMPSLMKMYHSLYKLLVSLGALQRARGARKEQPGALHAIIQLAMIVGWKVDMLLVFARNVDRDYPIADRDELNSRAIQLSGLIKETMSYAAVEYVSQAPFFKFPHLLYQYPLDEMPTLRRNRVYKGKSLPPFLLHRELKPHKITITYDDTKPERNADSFF